jgi:large repetitive protein
VAQARTRPRRSRASVIGITAVIVVLGVLATLAVTAQGYQAQVVPRVEPSVWVTRDSGQYARVNTDLGEIDTVRDVSAPTDVVQVGSQSVVFSEGDRQAWQVSAANPVDLTAASTAKGAQATAVAKNTPIGTRTIVSAGTNIVYLTNVGKVFLGALATGADGGAATDPSVTSPVDPFASDQAKNAPTYVASAVAVSATGQLAMYSAAEHAVRLFDATTHQFAGSPQRVPSPPAASTHLQLALVAGKWVLSSPTAKKVWIQGRNAPVKTGLGGNAQLESSTSAGDRVYLADSTGLVSVSLASGTVTRVTRANGVAAMPTEVAGVVYAAWLSATGGALYSSATGKTIALQTDGKKLGAVQAIAPAIRTNGQRAVLSEQSSGLLWTIPNGALIPLSEWSPVKTQHDVGTVKVTDVAQEEPPVAVADAFGVRHGAVVQLPLLLNDHDPNKKDVLSIVPGSISGGLSDPSFGNVGLVDNNQEAVVTVRASAGTATFSYTVTDGTLTSAPVTVSLTVVPGSTNSPPKWCGVASCVQKWPTPQIAPGGTITVPVLIGWVDPDGDPFVLSDARKLNASDPVTVVPTSDGSVAIRHVDPNASASVIPILVTVTDSAGGSATKTLTLTVTGSPALVASPAVVVTGVGDAATVAVADHVSGGSGAIRLLDATASSTGNTALTVTPNTAAGQIGLSANRAGEYVVTYTVQDTQTQAQQSSEIRLSVISGTPPLTMAPLTAFVRANQDTTIDVVDAVQNSSGRVLIVSSVVPSGPLLSASVVGQSSVRVSGSTASGQPGLVGTAEISIADGTGATVQGTLTVFLVPPSTDTGPIAEPDAVTVRVGEEVDVPVTTNDVSPRGERLIVSPTMQGSGAKGDLAFVSGDLVRYLAPDRAGTYTLHYSVYLDSNPALADSAAITVTVLPKGTNRPPEPPVLTARVLSGQTVTIPVPSYGIDPDGDAVTLASVAQPPAGSGSATISADGASILYAAPGNGVTGGQIGFGYTVRDSQGMTATGTVRVGVLNTAIADSSPVTYSDYVRVTKDATVPVTVDPLLNDSDPAQGTLKLLSLVPDAPNTAGNPEYARLKALIDPSTDLAAGKVLLRAGSVLGTQSYVYTARSSVSSSTSEGLIVVTVSDQPSVGGLNVSDTVVTARTRNQFATGIDVVTGKVQWPTGNVAGLTLALWGPQAARYTVKGSFISGKLPAAGALVPFSLTGADAAGGTVVSYGFLRIPAFDDMRVQLKPDAKPIRVGEQKSVTFDLADEVDVAPNDAIETHKTDSYAVQRAAASCSPHGGTSAQYNAGRNAPWADSCTVPVRIVGQHTWTMLAVPITIAPKSPQAILSSISRTVAPGATETVDLYGALTTWEGDRVGDKSVLNYTTVFSGSAFIVTQSGTSVSIVARADAAPGTRDDIKVSVTSYGGLTANINLVVGVAPPDAPIGATFTKVCHVTDGPSCSIVVVGASGEYDPFKGKIGGGLHLVNVGGGTVVNCAVAEVVVAGDTSVTATWPAGPKPSGGECTVPYTVKDAQGRLGLGTLTIDVQGYPAPPSSITTTGYTGTSVTLTVALGAAAQAHPSLTGINLYEGGSRVTTASCSPSGSVVYLCTVSGLVNGAVHHYTARAVNSSGESLDTTAVATWAYQAPVITSVSSHPEYVAGETTRTNAVVQLSVASGDDTRSFVVSPGGETIARNGAVTTQNIDLPPGTPRVTITPISQFQPPIAGDSNQGTTGTYTIDEAPGAPYFNTNTPSASSASNTSIAVNGITLQPNFSTGTQQVEYLAWQGGGEPSCTATGTGGMTIGAGGVQSTSSTITGLDSYTNYFVKVCATNGYGVVQSSTVQVFTGVTAPNPTGTYTYTIGKTAVQTGANTWEYELATGPSAPAPAGFTTYYLLYGSKTTSFLLSPNQSPGAVSVEYCSVIRTNFCSAAPAAVTPINAPTVAIVTFLRCASAFPDAGDVNISPAAHASASVSVAPSLGSVTYTVTWSGDFGLDPLTSPAIPTCTP